MDLNYFDLSYEPRFDLKGMTTHPSLKINLYGTDFMNSLVIVLQLSFLFYSNDLTASVVFLVVGLLTIEKDDIMQDNHAMNCGKEWLVVKTFDQMVFNMCTIIHFTIHTVYAWDIESCLSLLY